MTASALLLSRSIPSSAICLRFWPSNSNGFRDDADGENPHALGDFGDDGRRARPRTAAHPRGDEDHIRSREGRFDFGERLFRGLSPDFRAHARSKSPGDVGAELDNPVRVDLLEDLQVRVHRPKLDSLQPDLDHAPHGVVPTTADPDHLDFGGRGKFVGVNYIHVVGSHRWAGTRWSYFWVA